LSPLIFYLMTFWKDAWAMVLLLWMGVLAFNLYLGESDQKRFKIYLAAAVLAVLIEAFTLVRHNTLPLLPLFSLCFGWVLYRRRVPLAGLLALALIPTHFALDFLIRNAFAVQRTYPERYVMAMDLVGLCVLDESLRASLPFTSSQLR